MDKQFVAAVKEMRIAQKEYFRTRDKKSLQRSKSLEKMVDELLAKYDNPQKELFKSISWYDTNRFKV